MDLYGFDRGQREAGRIQSPLMARAATADVACELLVPEYKPEIRRVLSVSTTLTPPAHYISGGHAEFAGNMEFLLCYEGADGSIVGIAMPQDYEFDLVMDNDPALAAEDLTAYADVVCESATARVTAPRRVALRARLNADAVVLASRAMDVEMTSDSGGGSGGGETDIRRRESSVRCAQILRRTTDAIEYSDLITPEDGGDGELRVITCRARPFVSESAVMPEGVAVRGNICISLLYCRMAEGARPILATARIPFSETVSFDSVPPRGAFCRAWGSVGATTAEVTDNRGVDIGVRLILTAELLLPCDCRYTADVYSLANETSLTRRDIYPALPLRSVNSNVTISGTAELAAHGLDSGIRIVWADAEPTPGGTREGRVLSGDIRVRMLADNGAEVRAVETLIPYKYTAEQTSGDGAAVDIAYGGGYSECDISCPTCRARVDGERIAVDCELALAARYCGRGEIDPVCEVRIGDPRPAREGDLVVCYPAAEDTLWSIGRRYGRDAASIAEGNNIPMPADPAADPIGVKFLLI